MSIKYHTYYLVNFCEFLNIIYVINYKDKFKKKF